MTAGTTGDSPEDTPLTGKQARLVDSYWGEVHDDRSEIHTEIGVVAPNLLETELDGIEVGYEALLNDVSVAEADGSGVELRPNSTELRLDAEFLHDRVPDWWRSHVENEESTRITVEPELNFDIGRAFDIAFPLKDVSLRTPGLHRSFETDVLDTVPESCPQETSVFGRTVFEVEDVTATWGEATETETPVEIEATVTNHLPVSAPIADVRYEIKMNDVVVGEGEAEHDGLPVNSTAEIETEAAIDLDHLVDWWPSHVEADGDTDVEETKLEVEFYAAVGVLGFDRRVTLFRHEDTVETAVFVD